MHAHNAAAYLERSLPLVLAQEYSCHEVLVVVDNCTDLTLERMEQMEIRWPSLRHIVIPDSAWHHDRHRLAVMLAAKAARHDWLMIVQPEYVPQSSSWLAQMAAAITPSTQRVMGFCGIEGDEASQESFVSAFEQWLSLSRRVAAVDDSNTLILRRILLDGNSASPLHTAVVASPATALRRTLPYGGMWWREQLRRIRRHVASAPLSFRLLHALAVWHAWLSVVAAVALGWFVSPWAAVPFFLLAISVPALLFGRFCLSVGQRPIYFSHLPQSLLLPFLLGK